MLVYEEIKDIFNKSGREQQCKLADVF